MTCDCLRRGQRGRVVGLCVPEALRRRLLDFGMTEGTELCCLRPCWGGPMLIQIGGTVLALRRGDRKGIQVAVVP
jgi:Fe2+ transport system protein FeoA